LRLTPEERQMVAALAKQLARSEADTLRLLVRVAYQRMVAGASPLGGPTIGQP
jgi:hypothetical protein